MELDFLATAVETLNGASALNQWNWGAFLTSAVVAAIVSAIGTLIGHRVARQNAKLAAEIARKNAELNAKLEASKQLSANRQNWINALREDMSLYFALTLESDETKKDRVRIYEVGMRIELRMNPKDRLYLRLRDSMHTCSAGGADDEVINGREMFIKTSQAILKKEWEVLKSDLQKVSSVT